MRKQEGSVLEFDILANVTYLRTLSFLRRQESSGVGRLTKDAGLLLSLWESPPVCGDRNAGKQHAA